MQLYIGQEVLLASGDKALIQGFDEYLVHVCNFTQGFNVKVPAESVVSVSKLQGPLPIWKKGQEVYSQFLGYGEVLGQGNKERVYVQFNNGIGAPVFIQNRHLQEKPEELVEADDSWMEEIDF
jgi:hypothetical protein